MTKKEIVKTISEELGLTQLKTKEIVQKTFDAIVDTLVEEKRIELRNFGVFEVKQRAPRKARNPRTGEKVFVPQKFVVTFKPGKEMEERVRRMIEAQGTGANLPIDSDDEDEAAPNDFRDMHSEEVMSEQVPVAAGVANGDVGANGQ